jgi:NodT family efflux transporter outer membrane factor (OMF) lipoprotein
VRPCRFLLTASLVALTAACAVGPDFERPAAPGVASYDEEATLQTASADGEHGASQSLTPGEALPAEWWTLFRSAPLNAMIAEALQHNPDLEAAEASLRAAEEDLAAGDAVLFPTATASFTSERQKTSAASAGGNFPGKIFTLHNASVGVSYGLDVFGGERRQIEGLEAQRDYQRFQLEAARLSLTANVVTTAIREASLRGQIEATNKLIGEQEKQLDLLKRQLDAGGVTRLAVLAQATELAQSRATLPPLAQQLAQTRHALSTLTGAFPTHAPRQVFELASLHLPEKLPLTLPSQLVEQRPDVRAAEANLHAASAAIGVAEANRLPQITLSASIGTVANTLGTLFMPGGGIWALGGGISETIFDAGANLHKQNAAEADYDAAAAIYRKTVLSAFQDVADTLRALENDAAALKAQSDAERAASDSLKLALNQFDAGAISYLALLDSEKAERRSRIALVQAEAQRFADTAALFQALGGGWNANPSSQESKP